MPRFFTNLLRIFFIVYSSVLYVNAALAQCACTNCPVTLPNSGTAEGFLTITGAVSNVLNTSQFVKAVNINVDHDALRECEITLIAPNGSSILLSDNSGIAVNNNITYDICILDCTGSPVPDPGFPINFTSNANYMSGQTYTGSYFTYNGACLSTLTGPVNGQWTLRFQDFVAGDGGILNDWSIELADNSGTTCTFVCATPSDPCDAEGGELENLPPVNQFCENDPDLQFSIDPDFNGNEPDVNEYSYVFVLNNITTNQTIEYNSDQNFTDLAPGQYRICGLSYLTEDEPDLPVINGTNLIPVITQLISNNTICADLSTNCFSFTVQPVPLPVTLTGPVEVCEGELVTYTFTNPNTSLTPVISIISGSFGLFNVSGNQINVIWLSGPGEICISVSNVCGSFEDCIEVVVNSFSETFTLTGELTVCQGDEETYVLNPGLPPGFTNEWTVSNGFITSQTDNTVTVQWNNGGTGQVCYNVTDPCDNVTINCITVIIGQDAPPPVITMPLTACVDEVFTASVTPSNAYTAYNWSASPAIIGSGQGTPSITLSGINPGTTTVCIEVLSDCSPPQTTCRDIEIIEPVIPELEIIEKCSLTATLGVVSPVPGSSYQWVVLSGPGTVSFSNPAASQTNAVASVPGTYVIQLSENTPGCTGINTISVTFYPEMVVDDLQFDCTELTSYIVTFTISGGLPPYFVDGNQIAGNIFVSSPIPIDDGYSFIILDSEGCEIVLEGMPDCPCVSYSGEMSNDLLSVCENESAVADEVVNPFFDANDTGIYVLHGNPGNVLGTVFATSVNPEFGYLPTLQYGIIYYISHVTGNEIGGTVDFSDPCLSVSFGQPVVFHKIPLPFAGTDIQTCETIFELEGINDVPGSTVLWSVSGGNGVTILTPEQLNTLVVVTDPGSYQIILEENNEGCIGTDEINITVFEPLSTLVTGVECNPASGEYTVTFTISGGSLPYFVNGFPVTGITYNSAPIPSGSTYNFIIEDIIGCSGQLEGTFNCDCETRGGTMSSEQLIVCAENGSVTALYNNDGVFDADDIGMFVLHTGAGNILGTVLASNTSGIFTYDPAYSVNTTYYISYVIGNEVNGTVDLSDPCLGVSPGQPVIFRGNPVITINPVSDTCALVNTISIIPEAGVQYTWSTSDPNLVFSNITTTSADMTANIPGAYEITLTAANDVCISSVSVTVSFLEIPSVLNISYDCIDLTSYNAILTLSGQAPFVTDIPSSPQTDQVLLFENLPSATATTVLITSSNGCSVSAVLSFDCACQSIPGTMATTPLAACEGQEVIALYNEDGVAGDVDSFIYILHTSSSDVLGTVLATSSDGRFFRSPGIDFNTAYYISYVTVNFVNGSYQLQPCSFVVPGQPVIFYKNPEINWDVLIDPCSPEATFTITSTGNLVNLTLVSAPPAAVISNQTTLGFTSDRAGEYTFSVEAEENGCTSAAQKMVTVFDSPVIENVFADCKGLLFDVSFDIDGGTSPYLLNGTTNILSSFTSGLIASGDVYSFFVLDSRGCSTDTLDITLECNCTTDAGTLTGPSVLLCEESDLNPTFPLNYTLASGDGFVYILHDGTSQTIGNIIWQGSGFPVPYQNSFAGNSFFLVRVVGPVLPNGEIDRDDECSDISNSIEVRWSRKPDFNSSAAAFYCENQEIFIEIDISGTGTLEVFKNLNENVALTTSASGIIIQPASVQNGDVIYYRYTDDINCVYDLGSDVIAIQALPNAGNTTADYVSCVRDSNTIFLPDFIDGEDVGGTWYLGNTFLPVDQNFEVSRNLLSDTTLYYIVNNACGTDTSLFNVLRRPLPQFTLSGLDPACAGESNGSITILPDLATNIDRIELNGEPVTNLNLTGLSSGEFEIRVVNEFGCSYTEKIQLENPDEIFIDLGPDLLVDSGENVLVTVTSNLASEDISNIIWTLPSGEIINGLANSVNVTVTDTSLVQVTVFDENGCSATRIVTIFVRLSKEDSIGLEDIFLPNIIIPGSGQNGVFSIPSDRKIFSVQTCSIYDRWGNKVYQAENVLPAEISWDGSFNGDLVNDGVYVYYMAMTLANGKQRSFTGDITVISR